MKGQKGYTFFLIFFLAITAGILLALKIIGANINKQPQVKFPNGVIYVDIAKTAEERNQGLSERKSMSQNQGMLFVFDKIGNYGFWMNKMNFNLDFIYLTDNKIVDLIENVPSPKEKETPVSVKTEKMFNKVLEVNTGIIKSLKLKIGDSVTY